MSSQYRVTLNGESITVTPESFERETDALVARHGGGIPSVVKLDVGGGVDAPLTVAINGDPTGDTSPRNLNSVVDPKPIRVGEMDTVGRARSERDYTDAVAAGFAPAETVYARGLRAEGMGRFLAKFESLEFVRPAMDGFRGRIADEERRDVNVNASTVRMDSQGRLVIGDTRYPLSADAISPLSSRLGMVSAGGFLRSIPAAERAFNVNHAADRLPREGRERVDVKLRTRRMSEGDGRYVWAVTSDTYAPVDANRIADAIARAIRDPGARADVTYDGRRSMINVFYFSNVSPADAVAGEFFQTGVRVVTADDGSGSVRVSVFIGQNLCLNFIIIDDATSSVGRFVHRGSVSRLEDRISRALYTARARIGVFVEKWGYACAENLADAVDSLSIDTDTTALIAAADALLKGAVAATRARMLAPKAFASLLVRKVVPVAATAENVVGMVRAFEADVSSATRNPDALSRAALVNATTRFAHEAQSDAWVADGIERAAGRMLNNKRLF